MEPADVVVRFLEAVGRPGEAEFYLALFQAEPRERFAAVVVDGSVARHAFDAVALDLRLLAALGLFPLVVMGLHEADAQNGVPAPRAVALQRLLEKADVPSRVFASPHEGDLADAVAETIRSGAIPIASFGPADGASVEDRYGRLGAALGSLGTRKLIFLARRGGFRVGGAHVSIVNLSTEADALARGRDLSPKQALVLAQARRLVLDLVPHRMTVAVTSPLLLLRELFTVKGAGTLLRRGAVIVRRGGLREVDRERLRALLAAAFGRPPVDDFFDRPASRIYLEDGYRGAAIVVDTPLGAYVSKFAVEREAQGEGIGGDLWTCLEADHPALFWRARAGNPIVRFYTDRADGLVRLPEWHVFWKGVPPDRVPELVRFAAAQPIDIAPPETGPA